jgi:ketosteroid isomerase-like protein
MCFKYLARGKTKTMKATLIFLAVIVFTIVIVSSCGNNQTTTQNITTADTTKPKKADLTQQLLAANDSFYAALNAMFTGNMTPMDSIWSHSDDVTDMGPFGGRLVGWDSVNAEFTKEANMKLGGKVVCNDLIVHAGTDMGYTVCTEAGENMSAKGKPVMVSHRATNVFRLENGKWKLVHHHTDLSPQLQKAIGTAMK